MRSKPFFDRTQQGSGLISVTSPKGNRNVILAHLIRNLSERERDKAQPKTDIVLLHNDEMPDFYTVNVPIAVVEKLWKMALAGADVDLTKYSGEGAAYLASWPPVKGSLPVPLETQQAMPPVEASVDVGVEGGVESGAGVIVKSPSGKTKYVPRIAPF